MNGELIVDHGHGKRVSLEEVYAVPEVEGTRTWNPIHHKLVIESLQSAMKAYDYEIQKMEFCLSHNGLKMFCAFVLQNGYNGEKSFTIAGVNAMDKTSSIKVCAAIHVFICTNLALSGKFLEQKRHGGKLTNLQVEEMSFRALEGMERELIDFDTWHTGLKDYSLTRTDMEALTFRAMEQEVLPPSKFKQFHSILFQKEGLDYYENNLYGFHGAMTELQNNNSLIGAGRWHGKLNHLIDITKADLNNYGAVINV